MAKIMIAEDERDIRELINMTLMILGHQLELCANGEELVNKAPKFMPDLILTDVRMPKMTGYEACRALKQNEAVKHIPVVMLTAKGQDEEAQMGAEAGAYAYILKPFSLEDLQRRVTEILSEIGVQ
jgi:CheY-like chemotaxis protein